MCQHPSHRRITERNNIQYFPGCFIANKFFPFCINVLEAFDDKAIRFRLHELYSFVIILSLPDAVKICSLQLLPHLLLLTYCAEIGNQCFVLS